MKRKIIIQTNIEDQIESFLAYGRELSHQERLNEYFKMRKVLRILRNEPPMTKLPKITIRKPVWM